MNSAPIAVVITTVRIDITLEVTYYHVIFTLPQAVNPWVEIHPEVIYELLLKSAWATLESPCPSTPRTR
jgi:hypothetical protein